VAACFATTYEGFLADAQQRDHLRPHTLRAYRYELARAATEPSLAGDLDGLSLADLEQWIARDPATPSTIDRRAATFRRFFAWALRQDLCTHNPMSGYAPCKVRRRQPRPIREQREQQGLDAAMATAPPPYRLILTILRETGMRMGEVLALRRSDVTLDAGRKALRVREPKNGTERVVVLGPTATPRTLRALRAHCKTIPAGVSYEILFRSPRGTAVSYDAVHYQWARVCARAGLVDAQGRPRYTLHQLRHTRGSDLLAQGQCLEIVQRVLGHRDIRSTLGYADLAEAQVRAALEDPDPRAR
jgi:integrase/recombinase XerD